MQVLQHYCACLLRLYSLTSNIHFEYVSTVFVKDVDTFISNVLSKVSHVCNKFN